ncbi:MAG: TolC family protein [Candidatus Brocadiia bacterium]
MRSAALLLTTCALLLAAGCQATQPGTIKSARDVNVNVREAERAFLYSQVDTERLLSLGREDAARLYRLERETGRLEEIRADSPEALAPAAGQAYVALSVEEHGPSINLWNWTRGEMERVELRLDSLQARPVAGTHDGPAVFDVVFTGQEAALFPFCADKDYELFKARLRTAGDGVGAELAAVTQLTHNSHDDTSPAFSPDGHWIVYVSEELGPRNIALMDSDGQYVRLLTREKARSADHPVVLPDNEQCLYVCGTDGETGYYVCGLDGRGHRRASAQELKQMLFSWDDRTRHAYLMTETFGREESLAALMELPRKVGLGELLGLAELNSPGLEQYREKIRAARNAREGGQLRRGPQVGIGATHMVDVGVFVSEPEESPQDRPAQGFTRYLLSAAIPLFSGSLDRAVRQRDRWQEVVYSQTYRKRQAQLYYEVASRYFDFSEQLARARALRRILDLNRKRRFLLQARMKAGLERPDRMAEADAYVQESEAELEAALGEAEVARERLMAAVGLEGGDGIQIEPAPLDWERLPVQVPLLPRMQALAQVNHPDIARLKFLELRAAAIRDMGAPENRSRPTLHVHYGLGAEHFFSETVDDFISTALTHAIPLKTLGLEAAYREQWTHEMMAYRREREQIRRDIHADLAETHAALRRLQDDFQSALHWRDLAAQRARLSRIYKSQGSFRAEPPEATDVLAAEIAHLRQVMDAAGVRADFWRHLGQYYYRTGLVAALPDVFARPDEPRRRGRALYLWRSLEVALHPEQRELFLRTCAEHGISRVYCFISRVEDDLYLRRHKWEFGYFLDLCRRDGIEVYALVGNPQWLRESYRSEVGALLRSVAEFNARRQEGHAGFAGVKVDVEPHALPGWQDEDRRAELARQYLEMLDYARAHLGPPADGLRLAADVPHTWADVTVGEEGLFRAACQQLDEATVMAYLDDPERIVTASEPLVQTAADAGVPVEVAVETNPVAEEGVSFAGHSIEELTVALDRVYDALVVNPAFAGFAIHDYSGLRQMIEASHAH